MVKRIKLIAAVSGLALTAVLVPAVPALAATGTFGGCTLTANPPVNSGGTIDVYGAISCSTSGTRAMRVDLYHNYDLVPDALVTGRTLSFSTSISHTFGFCDPGPNGASTTYYTETTSYKNSIQVGDVDSSNRVLTNFC